MIIGGEGDRREDDGSGQDTSLLHGLDRVRRHVGLVHGRLYGLMQRTAFGGEVALAFDENDRGHGETADRAACLPPSPR